MGKHWLTAIATPLLVFAGALCAGGPADSNFTFDRDSVVRALLERSRLLENIRVSIPRGVYELYITEQARDPQPAKPPVAMIAEEGLYTITGQADGKPVLTAAVRIRVFDPAGVRDVPVVSADSVWEKLQINGKDAKLPITDKWYRFAADRPGVYEISAEAPLEKCAPAKGRFSLPIPQTVRTLVRARSPLEWEVKASGRPAVRGNAKDGTDVLLALTPQAAITVEYAPPVAQPRHAPQYRLAGDVAWNIDAGRMQVSARLDVGIWGGESERIELTLPASAVRASVTGPDVREAQFSPGLASVFLRGPTVDRTTLNVQYELPAPAGEKADFAPIGVRDGRWAGGTLVVTNTAGSSEVMPDASTGLQEISTTDLSATASAILAGPPAMAYSIVSPSWSASVEVLNLSEAAVTEALADLGHFQVYLAGDGVMICKAEYEVRNRVKQFLTVTLPEGSRVLLSKVNDKSRPLTAVEGGTGFQPVTSYILPLERSRLAVKGLISFPVEVVYLCRLPASAYTRDRRTGEVSIPIPRIDMPVAYAWCEAYLPAGLKVKQTAGPMQQVAQYSSQTAAAKMDYGSAQLAEGYDRGQRFQAGAELATPPAQEPQKASTPILGDLISWNLKRTPVQPDAAPPAQSAGVAQPLASSFGAEQAEAHKLALPATQPAAAHESGMFGPAPKPSAAQAAKLGANYYRAGKDYYDQAEYDKAAESLSKAVELAPGTPEAGNASRLLDNIKLTRGKLDMATKVEKVAGAKVRMEFEASNRSLVQSQEEAVQNISQALERGDKKKAAEQYQALEAMNKELVQKGAVAGEQQKILKDVQARLGDVRKSQEAEAQVLRARMSELKAAGKYSEALAEGKKLREQQQLRGHTEGLADLENEMAGLAVESTKQLQSRKSASMVMDQPAAEPDVHSISGRATRAVDSEEAAAGNVAPRSDHKRSSTWGARNTNDAGAEQAQPQAVTKVYDVRSLVLRTPNVVGPRMDYNGDTSTSGNNGNAGVGSGNTEDNAPSRQQMVDDLISTIKSTVGDSGGSIRETNGQLVVTQSAENQRAVEGLIRQLQEVRGPQFEESAKQIVQQRASGMLKVDVASGDASAAEGRTIDADDVAYLYETTNGGTVTVGYGGRMMDGKAGSADGANEWKEFVSKNYDWQRQSGSQAGDAVSARGEFLDDIDANVLLDATQAGQSDKPIGATRITVGNGQRAYVVTLGATSEANLRDKLYFNRGQAVPVAGVNLNTSAGDAARMGAAFNRGANGVTFAVVDEAVFRTLMNVDEANRKGNAAAVAANERRQETIVGTDALLPNGWTANVAFAAEASNTLDIRGNTIALPHGKYVLIDNGGYLTAVRADQMRHWTQRATEPAFAEVPQTIDVPRVGQLLKFEKTLVQPTDELVLKVTYQVEGD